MKRLSLVLVTSLALCGVALAEDKATTSGSGSEMQKSDKMKGPPNADGAQKSGASTSGAADTTGTAGGGAAAAKASGEAEGSKK